MTLEDVKDKWNEYLRTTRAFATNNGYSEGNMSADSLRVRREIRLLELILKDLNEMKVNWEDV